MPDQGLERGSGVFRAIVFKSGIQYNNMAPIAGSSRIPSGIPGFDPLIEGWFLENSVNLVTGETGTGKTTFCSQFLWNGLQKGETGLYITLEERPEDIKADAAMFGWDFDGFEKKGLCRIIYHDPAQDSTTAI